MITLSPSRSTSAKPCSISRLSSARMASYLLLASLARLPRRPHRGFDVSPKCRCLCCVERR
jgi:hypothetical protein